MSHPSPNGRIDLIANLIKLVHEQILSSLTLQYCCSMTLMHVLTAHVFNALCSLCVSAFQTVPTTTTTKRKRGEEKDDDDDVCTTEHCSLYGVHSPSVCACLYRVLCMEDGHKWNVYALQVSATCSPQEPFLMSKWRNVCSFSLLHTCPCMYPIQQEPKRKRPTPPASTSRGREVRTALVLEQVTNLILVHM